MTEIFLAPCSKQGGDSRAYQNLQQTVLNPVDLSDYEDIVPEPYQGEYRVWGLTDGLERSWIRISDGDYLLFYTGDRTYRYAARVLGKEHNLELSIKLWPNYQAGETGGEDPGKPWEYLIYLAKPTAVNIDSAWLDSLADNQSEYPVGFRRLNDTGNRRLRDRFGSIEEFIQEKMTNSETSDESDGGGAGKTLDQDEFVPDIQPPKRTDATISRIIRNTERAKDLKKLYNHRCQVCDEQRRRSAETPYAEVHHLQPLGGADPGPDIPQNMLVLCPNHHADFDYGMIRVDVDTYALSHEYDDSVDGTTLTVKSEHPLDDDFLQYHNRGVSTS